MVACLGFHSYVGVVLEYTLTLTRKSNAYLTSILLVI